MSLEVNFTLSSVTLIPEVVVAMENDPPRSYCVQTSPPAPEDLKIRVDIVDAVGTCRNNAGASFIAGHDTSQME